MQARFQSARRPSSEAEDLGDVQAGGQSDGLFAQSSDGVTTVPGRPSSDRRRYGYDDGGAGATQQASGVRPEKLAQEPAESICPSRPPQGRDACLVPDKGPMNRRAEPEQKDGHDRRQLNPELPAHEAAAPAPCMARCRRPVAPLADAVDGRRRAQLHRCRHGQAAARGDLDRQCRSHRPAGYEGGARCPGGAHCAFAAAVTRLRGTLLRSRETRLMSSALTAARGSARGGKLHTTGTDPTSQERQP